MAGSETRYTFWNDCTLFLEIGRANTSQLPMYVGSDLTAPTLAGSSYVLKSPSGETVATKTEGSGLTLEGSPGILTAAIDAADLPTATLSEGENYREEWTVVTPGGESRSIRRTVVLGSFELHPPVREADLVAGEYPDLVTQLGPYTSTGLKPFMDQAWSEVCRKLHRRGISPDILVEPSDVYDLFRHTTYERVFRALLKFQDTERWRELWQFHLGEKRAALAGLGLTVDRDRDGNPDSLEKEGSVAQVHINAPPARRWRNLSRGRW